MADDQSPASRRERWLIKWRVLAEVWPKLKTPLQLITSQLIGWAIRKWLG